jgi:hypothetical protein
MNAKTGALLADEERLFIGMPAGDTAAGTKMLPSKAVARQITYT